MPAANFEDFCASVCSLAGVPPPRLEPDAQGAVGFSVKCNGIDAGFARIEQEGRDAMLMVVRFGQADPVDELHVLRKLLDTNFLLSGAGSPMFVREPRTGEIALHRSCLLSDVDVHDVYSSMTRFTDAAMRWGAGEFNARSQ